MMDLGLKDKVAIVTGGSDGIGKAAAASMAGEGAQVVIVARRPDVLQQATDDVQAATQGVVLPIQGDVAEAAHNLLARAAVDRCRMSLSFPHRDPCRTLYIAPPGSTLRACRTLQSGGAASRG